MLTFIIAWTVCGIMSAMFMSRMFTINRAREEAQRRLK